MKPETIKAIIETRTKVGNLGKAAFNPHVRYKYVSIDTYYEKVAAAAAANGLAWVANETKFDLLPDVGKTGIIRATYAVTLMHSSGDYLPNFSSITIVHPIQGAQTVGSAMSYLDKVFMRQIFAVSTGEEDADATNPEDVKLEKPDYGAIERLMIPGVEMAENREDLKKFWSENSNSHDTLKLGDKAAYARVVEAFKTRNQKLKD